MLIRDDLFIEHHHFLFLFFILLLSVSYFWHQSIYFSHMQYYLIFYKILPFLSSFLVLLYTSLRPFDKYRSRKILFFYSEACGETSFPLIFAQNGKSNFSLSGFFSSLSCLFRPVHAILLFFF